MSADPERKRETLKNIADTINETSANTRSAVNLLMGLSLAIGAVVFGTDDEALFLDRGATIAYLGVPLKLSTVYFLAPILYLLVYAMLGLKLKALQELWDQFVTIRDQITASEAEKNELNILIRPFFYTQYLAAQNKTARVLTWITLYFIPLAILTVAMLFFLPYQSRLISGSHWGALTLFGIMAVWLHKRKQQTRFSIYSPLLLPVIFCGFSFFAFSNRMDDGKINFPISKPFVTALDLSNKTLNEKSASPEILAQAYLLDKTKPLTAEEIKKLPFGVQSRLEEAKIKYTEPVFLRNRSFKGIDFGNTTAYRADFQGSNFQGAYIRDANFQGADMTWAKFQGAYMRDAQFQGAYMRDADFQGADMNGADFQGANMNGADFQGAYMSNADFQNANMIYAKFQGAYMINADFQNANMLEANFQNANMLEANFQGANITLANFQGALLVADFSQAQRLTEHSFAGAYYFSNPKDSQLNLKLPGNLSPEKIGMIDLCTTRIDIFSHLKFLSSKTVMKNGKTYYDYSGYCK